MTAQDRTAANDSGQSVGHVSGEPAARGEPPFCEPLDHLWHLDAKGGDPCLCGKKYWRVQRVPGHVSGEPAAEQYRIEADCAMRDYDGLELDAGIMHDALEQIANRRPNKTFDPWACDLARDALAKVRTHPWVT